MEESFIGEIKIFAGNFAPRNWAICDGGLLSVVQYDALFSLIGTTFGGDGLAEFAVPDLRGRVPIHFGQGNGLSPRQFAETGGAETVTLTTDELPAHTHVPQAHNGNGNSDVVNGNYWSGSASTTQFAPGDAADVPMNGNAVGANGGSQPHDNMLPFLPLNFIICLEGFYPSRN